MYIVQWGRKVAVNAPPPPPQLASPLGTVPIEIERRCDEEEVDYKLCWLPTTTFSFRMILPSSIKHGGGETLRTTNGVRTNVWYVPPFWYHYVQDDENVCTACVALSTVHVHCKKVKSTESYLDNGAWNRMSWGWEYCNSHNSLRDVLRGIIPCVK